MEKIIEKYLIERWFTEKGKELILFFLDHINLGDDGWEMINEKWKKNNDFSKFWEIPNKHLKDFNLDIDLRFVDLQNQHFENARFDSFNLVGANFKGSIFSDCSLQGSLIEDADFELVKMDKILSSSTTMVDSNFEGVIIENSDFVNVDLLGTNLRHSKIFNTDFINCYWIDIDAAGSQLKNVSLGLLDRYRMSKDVQHLTKTKQLLLNKSVLEDTRLGISGTWDVINFEECEFYKFSIGTSYFFDPKLPCYAPLLAKDLKITNSKLDDVYIKQMNLSNTDFSKCSIKSVYFKDSNLYGSNFSDVNIEKLTVDNTILDPILRDFLSHNTQCVILI